MPARVGRSRFLVAPPAGLNWPGPTNTGVPSGTSLTPSSGNFNTTSNGQTISNLDIAGAFVANHTNLIIQSCRITAPATEICALFVASTASGGTIQAFDCEFDVTNGAGTSGIFYDTNATPPAVTLTRCQIRRTENGVGCLSGFSMYDSYVYDLNPAGGDPHTDGLQTSPGVSNVTIVHNTFDLSGPNNGGNNSCIQLDVNTTGNLNWLIENNKLLLRSDTGGACVRLPNGDATANNVRVRNNRMLPGVFGYVIPTPPGTHITEWSGNVNDSTGAAVP